MDEKYVRCLMVETGYEGLVSQLLRVRELGRGMYPQRVRVRKLRGVWKKDRIRLLPGYVFVFSDENLLSGDIIDVLVTGAKKYDLYGEATVNESAE